MHNVSLGADVDSIGINGQTVLHKAAAAGDLATLQLLCMDLSADVNLPVYLHLAYLRFDVYANTDLLCPRLILFSVLTCIGGAAKPAACHPSHCSLVPVDTRFRNHFKFVSQTQRSPTVPQQIPLLFAHA